MSIDATNPHPANPAQVTELIEEAKDFTERMTGQPWACELVERLIDALTAAIGADSAEPSLMDRERAAMDVTQRRAIEAEGIADAVLSWMVKYDLLDAGNEYHASDVLAVLNDLAPSAAIGAGGQAVAPLDDDQIMEIIKEVAPWKHEPKLNDLLTYEKSPPLFPQATYDVPSYRAVNFVRAVEKRLSAIVQPGWREPDKWRSKLNLWFFRDLSDEQRLKLFSLFELPVDEIGKVHSHQRKALDRCLPAAPQPKREDQ